MKTVEKKERNRLSIDSVRGILLTKYNLKKQSCIDFHAYVSANNELLCKGPSSDINMKRHHGYTVTVTVDLLSCFVKALAVYKFCILLEQMPNGEFHENEASSFVSSFVRLCPPFDIWCPPLGVQVSGNPTLDSQNGLNARIRHKINTHGCRP